MGDMKEQINQFERDSKILGEIAGKYSEDSNEYRALKHAAIALWYALGDESERFKDYVVKSSRRPYSRTERSPTCDGNRS